MRENSTTVKVLDQMRRYSDGYKISKNAWKEMKNRLELFFEIHMGDIIKIAENHNRHTIMECDVIEYFNVVGSDNLR